MEYLRTPDERFVDLVDFDYSPNYLTVDDTEGGELRVRYLDVGPEDAAPVLLVPASPDDPAAESNRAAWQVLSRWQKPFLTAFSDSDPRTAGADVLMQELIPGCGGQSHTTIENGGHFPQEDQGEKLARVVVEFIQANPL